MAAAQLEELKRMICNFRITELQSLLGFVGKQRSGKKQELLSRALNLLRNPTMPLMTKIKELNGQRLEQNGRTSNHGSSNRYKHQPYSELTTHGGHNSLSHTLSTHSNMPPMRAHSPAPSRNDLDQCRFLVLPFFDHLDSIIGPTLLFKSSLTSRKQENPITFKLNSSQIQLVKENSRWSNDGVMESDVQVQIRFRSCEQPNELENDQYPPCLVISINGKMVTLPNPIPTSKQGVDPRRPPRPLDLTLHCRHHTNNNLYIVWHTPLPNEPELPQKYCFSINLVRKRTADYLRNKVERRPWRTRHATQEIIKQKLSDDGDEIALTSLKVSLLCPLGKMKMQLPCLARTCDHIQCFDVSLFLLMNEKKPTWKCPVCDLPALYDDLFIDEYFHEICQKAPSSCDEILFNNDGTWQAYSPASQQTKVKEERRSASPKRKPVVTPDLIPDSPVQTRSGEDNGSAAAASADVIIISDSEDDSDSDIAPPIANKRPISAISSDSSLGISSISPPARDTSRAPTRDSAASEQSTQFTNGSGLPIPTYSTNTTSHTSTRNLFNIANMPGLYSASGLPTSSSMDINQATNLGLGHAGLELGLGQRSDIDDYHPFAKMVKTNGSMNSYGAHSYPNFMGSARTDGSRQSESERGTPDIFNYNHQSTIPNNIWDSFSYNTDYSLHVQQMLQNSTASSNPTNHQSSILDNFTPSTEFMRRNNQTYPPHDSPLLDDSDIIPL